MITVKITTVGASAGIILSKEALALMKVRKGDNLFLTETPDGGFRLTPYDPEFAAPIRATLTNILETALAWARG